MNFAKLKDELAADPLGNGYVGMTDAQAAAKLNALERTENVPSLTGSQILNAINKAEYLALSAADKQLVWNIIHLGEINPFGIEATWFVDMFGGSSATITTLKAIRTTPISRATELGIGVVKPGHVEEVRR